MASLEMPVALVRPDDCRRKPGAVAGEGFDKLEMDEPVLRRAAIEVVSLDLLAADVAPSDVFRRAVEAPIVWLAATALGFLAAASFGTDSRSTLEVELFNDDLAPVDWNVFLTRFTAVLTMPRATILFVNKTVN